MIGQAHGNNHLEPMDEEDLQFANLGFENINIQRDSISNDGNLVNNPLNNGLIPGDELLANNHVNNPLNNGLIPGAELFANNI